MNEAQAINKLSCFWSHLTFPNLHWDGCEMDLAVVTQGRLLWEVEVKLNLSDWRADVQKNKWQKPRDRIARMFYAVPGDLIRQAPEFVPASTGLISLDPYIKIVRPAKLNTKASRVTDAELIEMLTRTHYRFWLERRKRVISEDAVVSLRRRLSSTQIVSPNKSKG